MEKGLAVWMVVVVVVVLLGAGGRVRCADSSLQTKCGTVVTKLTDCLSYGTGSAGAPTTACCKGVEDIRATDPACLCFVIQQVHSGGEAVKSFGLRLDRLVALPAACKSTANISNCPKLLNLSPSSPDYSIFTNSTNATTTSTPTSTTSPSTGSTAGKVNSEGFVHEVRLQVVFIVSAIFLSIF